MMETRVKTTNAKAGAETENRTPGPDVTTNGPLNAPEHGNKDGGAMGGQGPNVHRKKPYQKPRLRVYGNIGALTATVNVNATADGGGAGMFRTH